jgi:DNA-binding MarR family transcriptional regulator
MKHEKDIFEIRDVFVSVVNKFRAFEKFPHHYGTGELLYPSELVTIETLGTNPGINVTELAKKHGITKGAVSQTIKKLEKKDLVKRTKSPTNSKEVLLSLTVKGEMAYHQHQLFHLKFASDFFEEIDRWTPEQVEFLKHAFMALDRLLDDAIEYVQNM